MYQLFMKLYARMKDRAAAFSALFLAASCGCVLPAYAADTGGGVTMATYLDQVGQVFTWILTHITELITFILGNPFLAVSLVLFMCGAVISFFIRIKNA